MDPMPLPKEAGKRSVKAGASIGTRLEADRVADPRCRLMGHRTQRQPPAVDGGGRESERVFSFPQAGFGP
jgi:hypothetical protein